MKKKSKSIPPLLSCSNDILRRAVVAIRDSRGEVNTQTQLVLSLRNNLQKQLNNRINTLNQVCGAVIPQIRIELLPNPADIAESGDLRIIVSTNAAASYIITAEYFDSAKISHIVEVDLVHYEATVRAKQNVNAVYAVPSIKAVESICVDILTDIAMYHSWGSFTSPKNDLAFRREFSQKKLAYAYEHNLTVPDEAKQVCLDSISYYSFAFSCHDIGVDNFDCKKYEAIWIDFLKPYILVEPSLKQQLLDFTKEKQLSRQKVQKEYKKIPNPGPYIMLVMNRRPKRHKEAQKILDFFGRKSWKNGTVKIVPLSMYERVARYYPYLAFFKIIRR